MVLLSRLGIRSSSYASYYPLFILSTTLKPTSNSTPSSLTSNLAAPLFSRQSPPHGLKIHSRMSSSLVTPWQPNSFPSVHRDESSIETFKSASKGEVEISDPYVWLHDPDSKETQEFVKKQGEFAKKYLDQYKDAEKFKKALTKNWDYPKFGCPAKKGDGNYYFTYNSGLQPQDSVYRFPSSDADKKVDGKEAGGELFFDEDGKYWAYALSRSGSDWTTCYVRPTASPHQASQTKGSDPGRLETDVLRYLKFSSINWTKDSKGFFYQRFPAREKHGQDTDDKAGTETDRDVNAMLYYHRIGTTQDQDILVYKDEKNIEWMFSCSNTDDGKYLVMTSSKDTARSNLLWIASLEGQEIGTELKWTKVINEWGTFWSDITNDGSKFYFYTNADDSSNYKIVTYDLEKPEEGFKDLIPHRKDALLGDVHVTNQDKLLLTYSIDVQDQMWLHDLKTGKQIKRIGEGLIGSVQQVSGRREDDEFWFSMVSFTNPTTIYRYQFDRPEGQEQSLYRSAEVGGIKSVDFISEQAFYKSKDGTKVPMFIVRPKDVKKDATAPAILYGYGGFSISLQPFFSPSLLTWISHYGGVLAVANLRGGGEYGESWHIAGTKENKQNVFDDFQYAAKYLYAEKYVAPKKIAISGGSNGGLLVAACVNQAPELFGSAVADVGVMDMLRFHRFTVGAFWCSDYGSSDDPEGFDYLYKISPLENVDASKEYPPFMLLTADHDDRVVPLHSFKLAAELQHKLSNNPNPLILRVDTKSGHGAGKSTEKKIEEAVDRYGFVAQSMGLEWRD